MERLATHSGTWYPSNKKILENQLNISTVSSSSKNGTRIIISPHAGYKYCSKTMLPAYQSLIFQNFSKQKNHIDKSSQIDTFRDTAGGSGDSGSDGVRVFVIGPSHHVYFKDKVLLTRFHRLETPFGNLPVDTKLIEKWVGLYPKLFQYMDPDVDLEEHSLEMQFPILYNTLLSRNVIPKTGNNEEAEEEKANKGEAIRVKVVPILMSHGSESMYNGLAKILGDFLQEDPNSYIIISSDFCHWGRRFDYTGYVGSIEDLQLAMDDETEIEMLTSRSKLSHHQIPIWSSIEILDRYAMKVLECGDSELWNKYLDITGNTICGREPLRCLLYVLNYMKSKYSVSFDWKWDKYSQSSQINSVAESSVSYSSGHITLRQKDYYEKTK